MDDMPMRLATRLSAEGEKTKAFFQDMPSDSWELTIYTEGASWRIRQVFAHLVNSESGIISLVKNILGGGTGSPEDFDLDRYNERKVAALVDVSPDNLLSKFSYARQETVRLVSQMKPEDLLLRGRHPFLGITTLEEIIKMIYLHNQIHIRDIRKKLNADR